MEEPVDSQPPSIEPQHQDTDFKLPIISPKKKCHRKLVISLIVGIVTLISGATIAIKYTVMHQDGTDSTPINISDSTVTTGNGTNSRYLSQKGSLKLPSGGSICFKGDYPNYAYSDSGCDLENASVRLLDGQHYVFQRDGLQYDISYVMAKCDFKEIQFESAKFKRITGCTMNIQATKLDNTKLDTYSKEFVLGAGIYIEEGGSSYAKMAGQVDTERTSLSPFMSADPIVQVVSNDDFGSETFYQIWASPYCTSKKVACTTPKGLYSDGSAGVDQNLTLHFATRRGLATFEFTPEQIYQKKKKVVELDHATASLEVTNLDYVDCRYYCSDEPRQQNVNIGTVYDRVKLVFSYHETSS